MTSGASVMAGGAFVVAIAFGSSPAGAQTTTTAASASSTTATSAPPSSTSTTASTTSTTQRPTSTTASPAVGDEVIVVIGANGKTILADLPIDAQATDQLLPRTGSSPMPVWLTGLALVVTGALALTFTPRRHLNLYALRSARRRP